MMILSMSMSVTSILDSVALALLKYHSILLNSETISTVLLWCLQSFISNQIFSNLGFRANESETKKNEYSRAYKEVNFWHISERVNLEPKVYSISPGIITKFFRSVC